VAYALKDVLARTKANQKAFSDSYQGTTSGDRLRRSVARLLATDRQKSIQPKKPSQCLE
jgi:hypothetical protein